MTTLAALAADLDRAGTVVTAMLRPAAQQAADSMKEDWRSVFPWSGSKHLPHLGGLIRSEVTGGGAAVEAQAWVQKTGQGNLAHLIEYGGPYNGAHPGGAPALAKAAPVFALQMAAIAAAAL